MSEEKSVRELEREGEKMSWKDILKNEQSHPGLDRKLVDIKNLLNEFLQGDIPEGELSDEVSLYNDVVAESDLDENSKKYYFDAVKDITRKE